MHCALPGPVLLSDYVCGVHACVTALQHVWNAVYSMCVLTCECLTYMFVYTCICMYVHVHVCRMFQIMQP